MAASFFSIDGVVSVAYRLFAALTRVASKPTSPSRTMPILRAMRQTCLKRSLSGSRFFEKNVASVV